LDLVSSLNPWEACEKTPLSGNGKLFTGAAHEEVFSFLRKGEKEILYIAVNRGDSPRLIWLPAICVPRGTTAVWQRFSGKQACSKRFCCSCLPGESPKSLTDKTNPTVDTGLIFKKERAADVSRETSAALSCHLSSST
jgi:hypothetical protein